MKLGKSTREAFGLALAQLGDRYPDLVVLDGDVHNSTRTEHFAKKYPARFFNVGIAESNLVGVAGGLASSGKRAWLASFAALEALKPARIVPGHGEVCELPKAQAQTRDYLQALRSHMKQAVENGEDIGAAIKAFDAKPWMDLLNAAELHPGNASRTYLELERE